MASSTSTTSSSSLRVVIEYRLDRSPRALGRALRLGCTALRARRASARGASAAEPHPSTPARPSLAFSGLLLPSLAGGREPATRDRRVARACGSVDRSRAREARRAASSRGRERVGGRRLRQVGASKGGRRLRRCCGKPCETYGMWCGTREMRTLGDWRGAPVRTRRLRHAERAGVPCAARCAVRGTVCHARSSSRSSSSTHTPGTAQRTSAYT